MMKQYPGFYVGIIGMAVYGVLTAIYVPWVLFSSWVECSPTNLLDRDLGL
jgi:hypothetical protein